MPPSQTISMPHPQSDVREPGAHLFEIYNKVKYLSIKHSSYFAVYEALFAPFVGKKITLVEVGILNGGSLFMWREYLGPQARIIGIDLNPAAKKWESEGFEIFIGNQSDPTFWNDLFTQVGPIDILLDDGGHTNVQQITTLRSSVAHVKDGGMIVVEDTHCSYFSEFGNPSRYSFIAYAKVIIDHINARNSNVRRKPDVLRNQIASVSFFESIVAFRIDRRLCLAPKPTSNEGVSSAAKDFRYDKSWFAGFITDLDMKLQATPILWRLRAYLPRLLGWRARIQSRSLRGLFK